MVVTVSNHGCLYQIHQRTKRSLTILLDTDCFLYTRRKDRDTPATYFYLEMPEKYRIKKCPAHVILNHGDQALASGAKPHFHDPDNLEAEKAEFRAELKRKAADQN